MDKKSVSHNKILTVYGLIGMLFYIGFCSLTTFNYCKKTNKSVGNYNETIFDYLAKVTQNVTNKKENITYTEFYFDNFEMYFDDFEDIKEGKIKEILIILIEVLCFFLINIIH